MFGCFNAFSQTDLRSWKASWNWHHVTKNVQPVGSCSSQKIRHIFIPSSTTNLQHPQKSTELPGSKASRWRRGGGSPSWDKICNGPVKGLKTEWQALPRGQGFSGFDGIERTQKGGTVFFGGGGTISFGKSMECDPDCCFFQLVLYPKTIKIPKKMISDHQRLASSPKSHSLVHQDAVVSRFSSVALKPWSTVQSAFLRGS